MTVVAGVDWAGPGWFAVVLDADAERGAVDPDAGGGPAVDVDSDVDSDSHLDVTDAVRAGTDAYPSLLNVVHETGADTVLVDVPVGLPADGPRECDAAARAVLGPDRAGSVFPTPCREAVYAPSYPAAKAVNEDRTGRSVTVQAWNIAPRIREADALLAAVPAARRVVREAHPEVCFRALAGRPMAHPKTTDDGVAERVSALETVAPGLPDLYDALVERFVTDPEPHARRLPPDGADDVLDALALAATALVGATSGSLATLPADPPTDERGLPMEIVHPEGL